MPPSKEDVLTYLKRQELLAAEKEPLNTLLRSAAIRSEELTGDVQWDSFLRRIQPLLEDAVASKQYWLGKMGDAFDELNRTMCQIEYIKQRTVEDTLKLVMNLPHEIIKEHRATQGS